MIFGMTPLTFFHVLLSLVGIVAGLMALSAWLGWSDLKPRLTGIFLYFTLATVLTGFILPFSSVTPAVVVGIITTVLLVVALVGYHRYRLAGSWRTIFLVTAIASLYLNTFVLVVQSFLKIPPLHALAPTGSEPPFAIVQGIVLLGFLIAGFLVVRRFRPVMA
jgi:hypothetical protein